MTIEALDSVAATEEFLQCMGGESSFALLAMDPSQSQISLRS